MKKFLCILFVLTAWGHAVSSLAQVRVISRTNDVRLLPVSQDALYWFQGETVQYDIYARNGRSAVVISNAAVPMWYVTDSTLTNYFVMNTGTVVSATNGHIRFTLAPTYSALTSKLYQSAAIVYFAGPTNPTLQLVVDRTAADVRKSFSYAGTYRGPITSTNWTLDGNTPVIGTFWIANSTSIYAAISNMIPSGGGSGGGSGTLTNGVVQGQIIATLTNNGALFYLTFTGATELVNFNAATSALWSGISARLASNVWAAAGSTTNYALRRDGRGSPIYGIGNVFSDGGHAAINEMNTRLDLRSTNKSFAVLGLYQTATNLNTDWPPALDLWNYGSTVTGVIPENIRSGKLLLGVHTATGTWGPQLYGLWGGASNEGFGLVTAFADSFGLPYERTRVTWQGLTVSGRVTASTGFVGDGASLTNIGSAALAQSVTTNIGARLASNVWASAESTTNYVRRTGGTYLAPTAWDLLVGAAPLTASQFSMQYGTFLWVPDTANVAEFVSLDTAKMQFVGLDLEVGGTIIGSGAGLTDIPLTSLRITNSASAGQVLATSDATNGYWATVTSGGGSIGNQRSFEWRDGEGSALVGWTKQLATGVNQISTRSATNRLNFAAIATTSQTTTQTNELDIVFEHSMTGAIPFVVRANQPAGVVIFAAQNGQASSVAITQTISAALTTYVTNLPLSIEAKTATASVRIATTNALNLYQLGVDVQ